MRMFKDSRAHEQLLPGFMKSSYNPKLVSYIFLLNNIMIKIKNKKINMMFQNIGSSGLNIYIEENIY